MSSTRSFGRHARGFTLVELVIVIVLGAIIAATLVVFFRPAVDSWLALRVRADLSDQATTALQTMQRDIRLAVPNSLRTPSSSCVELVPTTAGGRFRKDADTQYGGALPLDLQTTTTQFDVLSTLSSSPVGSWLVIDNQNPGDVYAGGAAGDANRALVTASTTPAATAGKARLTIAHAFNDAGYQGGRFLVVPATGPVFYVCSGADGSVDASGNGKGTLTRYTGYGFNASYPSACSAPGGASSAVLATRVLSCSFLYSPNQGATQQSGFVSLQLVLARSNEKIGLLIGAHVANVP